MENTVFLYHPEVDRMDIDAVLRCLLDDALGKKSITDAFSKQLAEYCNIRNVYTLRSYKHAVELAFRFFSLQAGSRIGLSALLPGIYAEIIREQNMEAVYIDVEPSYPLLPSPGEYSYQDLALDVLILDAPLGLVADIGAFASLNIPIIEDISQALASSRLDKRAGSIGTVVLFSMEVEDMLTSGGGAAVFFRDRRYSVELSRTTLLPALNASLGMTQLARLPRRTAKKKELYPLFEEAVRKNNYSGIPMPAQGAVFHRYPVTIDRGIAEVLQYAKKHSVEVKHAFFDCIASRETTDTRNAQRFFNQTILFPFESSLHQKDVEHVTRIIATLP